MKPKYNLLGAAVFVLALIGIGLVKPPPASAYPVGSPAAVLAQMTDNKAPWPGPVAATQFGVFYEFEDVYDYVAGTNWTVTLVEAGSGEADPVLSLTTATKGGSLGLIGDTNDNDGSELDSKMEIFDLDAGDTIVFVANITTGTDVTQCDIGMGVGITDTTWLGDADEMSDGIFFEKNDGDAYLDLVFAKDVSDGSTDYTRIARVYDLAVSTNYKLCFIVTLNASDSTKARYRVLVNDQQVASGSVSTDVPDDEGMCLKVGLQQGEATNLKTLQINSIGAAQTY